MVLIILRTVSHNCLHDVNTSKASWTTNNDKFPVATATVSLRAA